MMTFLRHTRLPFEPGQWTRLRFDLHPLALLGLSAGVLLLIGWCAAATTYALSQDRGAGIVGGLDGALRRDAQKEAMRLRDELQRVSSLHLVEKQEIQGKLQELFERQKLLERQKEALDALDRSPSDKRAMTEPGLSRASASVQDKLRQLALGYDRIEAAQKADIAEASSVIERRNHAIKNVLRDLGLPLLNVNPVKASLVGPFIPLFGKTPSEAASGLDRLSSSIEEQQDLRARLAHLPLRAPIRSDEVTSPYGSRVDPFLGRLAFHSGVDLKAPSGSPVLATASGTVVSAGWNGGYGLMVEVRHSGGFATRYGHLSSVAVKEGDAVNIGTLIGRVGSTGRSTGAHLHYEVRRDGEPTNPGRYLAAASLLD
ncbi:peptidoglycan DD-metalloendopeptidase family protein [Terrihabitans sp. B22-R8]|uniref:peptidoglycan DD-metalloendopeptidase family protein n=1 Tax=Terrihabitans sp. B22-R8 TaxID=3425128 RepID=UPI00403C9CAD